MFMQTQTAFAAAETIDLDALIFGATQAQGGLVAGTRVEAADGWRPVESLVRGDAVYTLDGGLRQIVGIDRADRTPARMVHVPGGALDNCADLTLLPGQHMLIEDAVADQVLDSPMALLPAAGLIGYRGIGWIRSRARVEVVTLRFEDEEIVFGNSGALLHCPAAGRSQTGAPKSDFFTVLGMEQARAMVALMNSAADDPFALRRAA